MIDYLLRTGIPASAVVLVWLAADRRRGIQARWLHRILVLAMLLYVIPLWPLLPRTAPSVPAASAASNVVVPAPDVGGTILPAPAEHPTPVSTPDVPDAPAVLPEHLLTSLTTVWSLGAVTFLAVQLGKAVRFRRRILVDSREASSEAATVLEDCRRTLGICRTVRLRENPHIRSPLVMGLFRPVILLPVIPLDPSELRCAFLHELTHLRRHDLWIRCLVLLPTALHWYNPCAHLLRRGIQETGEQACDEQLAGILSRPERIAYGYLLLRLADQEPHPQAAFLSARDILERRLHSMLHPKQRNPRLLALTLAVLTLVCVCTACAVREPLVEAGSSDVSQLSDAAVWSYAGTVFTYEGADYDLAERCPAVTSILDCTPVGMGDVLVVEGHCSPNNSCYGIFDTKLRQFVRDIAGCHLIWRDDDITTAVYSFWADVCGYNGQVLYTADLAEGEYISDLAFVDDGLAVTIRSGEDERTLTVALPETSTAVQTGVTIDRNQAVWFRPEDIHDLQAVELVWWDGRVIDTLEPDGEVFDWLETHFGTAIAPRAYIANGCHATLYLQRTDGVLGKVLVSDSANHAIFQSDEMVFQWSDGDGQAFFDLFGLDGERLLMYSRSPEKEEPRAHFLYVF